MTEECTKPEFDAPTGPAPADLVIRDLIVGDGDEAKPGDNVTVHYAGVEYESGEEFDSSWGRGESIQFPLRGLIQGWQDGIPGMKVGGRRELVIPPHLAYGPAGGHFLGGKTLIFIIDLLKVGLPLDVPRGRMPRHPPPRCSPRVFSFLGIHTRSTC